LPPPFPDDEKELLYHLSRGDETALLAIYQLHWNRLFTAAFNVLKDRSACEDILQEIFLQVWLKRESLTIKTTLSAYLYAATRYQVFRVIRKTPVSGHVFDNLEERLTSPAADKDLHFKELSNRIDQIVDTLPEQCRLIFRMSREEHLSHKQIAERLGITPKTVENQIAIALKKLRASLGDSALILAIAMLVSG
jgi:RNA polymerase sigma-70 factor (family 1)